MLWIRIFQTILPRPKLTRKQNVLFFEKKLSGLHYCNFEIIGDCCGLLHFSESTIRDPNFPSMSGFIMSQFLTQKGFLVRDQDDSSTSRIGRRGKMGEGRQNFPCNNLRINSSFVDFGNEFHAVSTEFHSLRS